MQGHSYDFVVVGAGTMGRSTALYLALQHPQAKCALIEQYKMDHEEGSSHSKTRIIRTAYSDPFYRDLCVQCLNQNWKKMEQLFGVKLVHRQNYLKYIQIEQMYKQHVEVANSSKNIKQMSCSQVKKMFPCAPDIDLMGKNVFVEEQAGVIMAQKYMGCMLEYLQKHKNIDIFEQTELISIDNNGLGAKIILKSKQSTIKIQTKKVALTCGRWITNLIPSLKPTLRPIRQIVSYWQMKNPQSYKLSTFPCWCLQNQSFNIFSLPDVEGDGLKYGIHSYKYEDQSKYTEQQYINQNLDEIFKLMNQHFKGRIGKLKKLQNCYYTYTKTQDFLIDWTDQHQNILMVSACSGHGFKFSPIIGQIVSDLLHYDQSFNLFQKNRYKMRLFFHQGVDLK